MIHLKPRFYSCLLCFALPALLFAASWANGDDAPKPQANDTEVFTKKVVPFMKRYCFLCHDENKPRAGLNLKQVKDLAEIQRDQKVWRNVLEQTRDRHMPPTGAPVPSPEEREAFVALLHDNLNNFDEKTMPKNPGRVLIHRLSRAEYNNTIRDLLGVDTKPADRFPADGGGGGGFDNNADTLFVPPILMERYLFAAGEVLAAAKPERILIAKPSLKLPATEAAKRILTHFARLGFRRPVTSIEIERLLRLYTQAVLRKEAFLPAVKFALKGVLVSPHFLFRIEADRNTAEPYPLNDYELASRLSYFLWSSMPDEPLLRLAEQGRLRDAKVLESQIRRMMQDPKSKALAESFGGQWLRVRDLYTSVEPDPTRYPSYTPSLRDAMFQETTAFFDSILREDASVLTLLDADYTFLNEELAKHYGIEGVGGKQMRRVRLTDRRRGGVMTMASVLTLTSYPQRTSPVLRGKWVLEEILGAPSPPPPPNAGGLPADDAPREGQTFRQRLELHRKKPDCASCHNRMDPIGFGLENFDGVGRWREEVGGKLVDSSGTMATGEKFSGPYELKQLILARKEAFLRNLTEKALAYALGRGLEPYDIPAVKRIMGAVTKEGYRSSVLLREIVKSYPFQYRKNL